MTTPQVSAATPPRMKSRMRLLVIGLLLAVLVPVPWFARRAAARLEFFHVRAVEVRGLRYLKPETVLAMLALDTTRSVWDDTAPLTALLMTLPQIGTARISRRLPGTLLVEVNENLPIAFAPGLNGLEPVDSSGLVLPIDPASEGLDLPVANQRDVPLLTLLGAVKAGQPGLYRRISEISRDGREDIILKLALPDGVPVARLDIAGGADSASGMSTTAAAPAALRVRAQVGVSVSRLTDIFPVETDLRRRKAQIAELDLRYRDQVIARLQ